MGKQERLIQILSDYHVELALADKEVEYLNTLTDPDRLLAFLKCIFCGITFEEIKDMAQKQLTPDEIAMERTRILAALYSSKGELCKTVRELSERIEAVLSHDQDLEKACQKREEEAADEKQRAYETALQTRDAENMALRERIRELEAQLGGLKRTAIEGNGAQDIFPRKTERTGLFFRRRRKREDRYDRAYDERSRRQRTFEEEQFRDRILRSSSLDTEQKRFLLSCFADGMSYWEIAQCAYPEIPVEFMKVMLKRQEKETGCN